MKSIYNINHMDNSHIGLIPWEWNKLATDIAGRSFTDTQLSLHHQGLEKPHWLMYLISSFGFLL